LPRIQYYQLEVEAWQVKLQIISELGIESKAASEFEQYRKLLDLITADIDPEDRKTISISITTIKKTSRSSPPCHWLPDAKTCATAGTTSCITSPM
jgi:hypothetical protein